MKRVKHQVLEVLEAEAVDPVLIDYLLKDDSFVLLLDVIEFEDQLSVPQLGIELNEGLFPFEEGGEDCEDIVKVVLLGVLDDIVDDGEALD